MEDGGVKTGIGLTAFYFFAGNLLQKFTKLLFPFGKFSGGLVRLQVPFRKNSGPVVIHMIFP
jgi:hypothetical protein